MARRPAVGYAERPSKLGSAAARAAEAAVGSQVVLVEAVRAPGMWPADRIDRLDLAAKALAGARIEHASDIAEAAEHVDRPPTCGVERRPSGVGRAAALAAPRCWLERAAAGAARLRARHRAPRPRRDRASAASTTGPRRVGAALVVVADHLRAGRTPSAPTVAAKASRVGQRVAPVASGLRGATGRDRGRQWCAPGRWPCAYARVRRRAGVGEVEARNRAAPEALRRCQQRTQRFGRDQRAFDHVRLPMLRAGAVGGWRPVSCGVRACEVASPPGRRAMISSDARTAAQLSASSNSHTPNRRTRTRCPGIAGWRW